MTTPTPTVIDPVEAVLTALAAHGYQDGSTYRVADKYVVALGEQYRWLAWVAGLSAHGPTVLAAFQGVLEKVEAA